MSPKDREDWPWRTIFTDSRFEYNIHIFMKILMVVIQKLKWCWDWFFTRNYKGRLQIYFLFTVWTFTFNDAFGEYSYIDQNKKNRHGISLLGRTSPPLGPWRTRFFNKKYWNFYLCFCLYHFVVCPDHSDHISQVSHPQVSRPISDQNAQW